MKVVSTVVNPVPDSEGFHILECDKCENTFLINLADINNNKEIYCPFCGHSGGLLSFTNKIREKILDGNPQMLDMDSIDDKEIDIEQINNLINNLDSQNMDVEFVEYTVDELVDSKDFIKFEFICCDKSVKVSMENYHKVNYCSFCKGEVLLNINE